MKSVLRNLVFTLTALALGAGAALAADKKIKLKAKPYPLETCIVSGEKLDSMGEPVYFTDGDQEIGICCDSCKKDFNKDKQALLAKVDAAAKKVKPYPLSKCIVSDEALEDGKAVGVVVANQEYQFCCKSCAKDFKKEPAKFAKKLETAKK